MPRKMIMFVILRNINYYLTATEILGISLKSSISQILAYKILFC